MSRLRLFKQYSGVLGALLVGSLMIVLGEFMISAQKSETQRLTHHEALSQAATLRARIERELNTLLYLNSGLGSYLVVRHDSLQRQEIQDMLAVLHLSSRYVVNFGVAIGHRLTYVYPERGNEQAIGLNYREVPEQWPIIEAIIHSGQAALDGPLRLVQGGNGLIYRVPLFVEGRYWGLLSTVIDIDQMNRIIFDRDAMDGLNVAVYSRSRHGHHDRPVIGDSRLFEQPQAIIQTIDVPGGQWRMAVMPQSDQQFSHLIVILRVSSLLLAMVLAGLVYMMINHHFDMRHIALYDGLTGLPNRRLLEDRHLQLLARLKRNPEQRHVMMFIDLDGFKPINDTHGHKAGDAVLIECARRIQSSVRASDMVVRWGGDEFIVLFQETDEESIGKLVERLRASVSLPIEFNDLTITLGCSIGVACYRDTEQTLDELLRTADHQMYQDKALRKQKRTHQALIGCALLVATGLVSTPASAEPPDWVYAPLPLESESLTLARNQPLAALLTTILERPVQLRLYPTHQALIDAVVDGEVDFAELGPLPFLLARERVPRLTPVATFREPDGRAEYRCVISVPVDGIVSLQHLMHQATPPSVALTRPESTCGPTVIFWLLVAHGFDLAHIRSAYQGGHDEVAVAVLREQFLIGGMKDSVAQRFYGLGLRTLATSDPVPGFMLVVQPDTLSDQQRETLTQTLIGLDDARLHTLQNGRYGFAPIDESALKQIKTLRRLTTVFLNDMAE